MIAKQQTWYSRVLYIIKNNNFVLCHARKLNAMISEGDSLLTGEYFGVEVLCFLNTTMVDFLALCGYLLNLRVCRA